MASQTRLDGLPTELVEAVIAQLEFSDVCCLRQVGREISAKASQGSFKTHFVSKTIQLSVETLEIFASVTQRKGLGCLLQDLTLTGHVSLSDETVDKSNNGHKVQLLTTALTNLHINSTHRCLRSLTLALTGALGGGGMKRPIFGARREIIWQAAGNVAEVAASALKAAEITVEALDLYGTTRGCALSSSRLVAFLSAMNHSKLKCLSMSFSSEEDPSVKNNDAGVVSSIVNLLQSIDLEELRLHWYQLGSRDEHEREPNDRRFFDEIGQLSLPSLVSFTLKGFYTSQTAVVSFLSKNPQLQRLSLEYIHLEDQFGPIFEYIHQRLELDYLRLDDLYEQRLIHFSGAKGENHFPSTGGGGPSTIERTGQDARARIKYQPSKGRTLDSPQASNWYRRRQLQFGH